MKRLLTIFVAAALAFVGFAPAASAETADAPPERCERQVEIEERLEGKLVRIGVKAERIDARMVKIADRLENIDTEKKHADKRTDRLAKRLVRLEAKAAKNELRAERVAAKMAKIADECGSGEETPVEEEPGEETPVEEVQGEETD